MQREPRRLPTDGPSSASSPSSAQRFKSRSACAVNGNRDLVCYTTDCAVLRGQRSPFGLRPCSSAGFSLGLLVPPLPTNTATGMSGDQLHNDSQVRGLQPTSGGRERRGESAGEEGLACSLLSGNWWGGDTLVLHSLPLPQISASGSLVPFRPGSRGKKQPLLSLGGWSGKAPLLSWLPRRR